MIQQFLLQITGYRDSDTYTPVRTKAFFTVANRQKQPRCPSLDEWKNKMWSIHAMGYYSATKKEEVLILASSMNLENIMLTEIIQKQRDKYCMTPLSMNDLE